MFRLPPFSKPGRHDGPDLTTAGRRYSVRDLLDQVVNPSKVINDQFSAVMVITDEGLVHSGVVVNLNNDGLTLNTDLTDPNKRVTINRNTIDEMLVSKTSPMPAGLFNRMAGRDSRSCCLSYQWPIRTSISSRDDVSR